MTVKFELNHAGVRELLKSKAMQNVLNEYGNAIMSRAGGDYVKSTYVGTNRTNVSIMTNSAATMRDNLDNNTLLRALK